MSCQAIKTDSCRVDVNFLLSRKESCQLRLRNCFRNLRDCPRCLRHFLCRCVGFLPYLSVGIFVLIVFCTVFYSCVWIPVLDYSCHKTAMLAVEDVSIRSMFLWQYGTVATPEDQLYVKSEFDVTLSGWNRNSVAGCFSTYRRMVVYVGYHDKLILQQEVPLGFGLKPRGSRSVVVRVEGDHFPVARQLGFLLAAELRNASSVNLQMYFDTLVMRNDRGAEWIRMGCQVTARTPLRSFQVTGNLGSAAGPVDGASDLQSLSNPCEKLSHVLEISGLASSSDNMFLPVFGGAAGREDTFPK